MPSLLLGLGAPGAWAVKAIARGVAPASAHRRGMSIGAIPVGGGRWLGQPRGGSATLESRALSPLLEGDTKKPPCLMLLLIGLQV